MPIGTLVWVSVFFILVLLKVPIAISIGSAAIIGLIAAGNFYLPMLPNILFAGVNSYLLTAVPFFIMTGLIMSRGGISRRIFDFAESLVGWSPGGLGAVNIVASMIFGGISGSAVSDVLGLGPLEISEMEHRGYPRDYSAAVTVASAVLSPVIPPSVMMVIFAVTAGGSALQLLMAGLLPGLLLAGSMLICNFLICRRNKYGKPQKFSFNLLGKTFLESIWAILAPCILLLGIVTGKFTPTEAAIIAVTYSLLISVIVYRELKAKDLINLIVETACSSGVTMLILATAAMAAHIFVKEQVPQRVVDMILIIQPTKYTLLFMLAIFVLIVGCFIEGIAAVIIITPILQMTIQAYDISIIHFGVILVVGLAIGVITPPIGVCLFAVCTIVDIRVEEVVRKVYPFICILALTYILLVFVPQISEFLPYLLWAE